MKVAAAVRDSVAKDSAVKALAAKDSAAKDSTAKVAAAKAAAAQARTAANRARSDSVNAARTVRIAPESVAVRCARLLERVSLGEKLTDAERVLLRQRCPK